MRSVLTLFCCLLLCCACHHDDDGPETVERAVLVYMAADNNLQSQVMDDIREMMEGSKELPNGNRLILFVDMMNRLPYMMKVERGDTVRLQTFDTELKSSDPETLRMAMQWMIQHYQAESYGLVLWGHANGWTIKNEETAIEERPRRAYGVDVIGEEQWMDIPDMARVLADYPKLKFIFADCCAFMSVESAYELRHVTDYLIASPAEIPAEGAPYYTVVPALFSQEPTFYEQIADAYYEQTTYDNRKEPLAVMDLDPEKMDRLAQATATALTSFVPSLPDYRYLNVQGLIYYYSHTLFDMNDVMLHFTNDDNYSAWKQAFDEVVIYKTYTPQWRAKFVSFLDFNMTEERYGGVNMYVPQDLSKLSGKSLEMAKLQADNIYRMEWYHAASYDILGW